MTIKIITVKQTKHNGLVQKQQLNKKKEENIMEVKTGVILSFSGNSKEDVQNQYHEYMNQINAEQNRYRTKDASIAADTDLEGTEHYVLGFMLEEIPANEPAVMEIGDETETNDVVDNLLSGFSYVGGTK